MAEPFDKSRSTAGGKSYNAGWGGERLAVPLALDSMSHKKLGYFFMPLVALAASAPVWACNVPVFRYAWSAGRPGLMT